MALATASAVRAEGSFRKEQFCLTTDDDLDDLLGERIAEASAEVLLRVGAETYGSTETALGQVLATAEVYLATAKALQTIRTIVATWDAAALPAEFVDSRELGAIIARYREQSDRLLAPHELGVGSGTGGADGASGSPPYLATQGIAE